MDSKVRRLVFATTTAAIVTVAAVVLLFPFADAIRAPAGLVFWIAAALLASALPVQLPRGTVVSVSASPVVAAFILGGPLAGVIVAAIGSTDVREVRGEVPWYGTLYNHASIILAVVAASITYEAVLLIRPGETGYATLVSFAGALLAGVVLWLVNWTLSVGAVSARTGVPIRTVWTQDLSGIAFTMIGLVPLAWLMAQVFQLPDGTGWWATALFAVPLFTTRLAYARYVETRLLFEQTIQALSKAVDARDRYTRNHSSRVSRISEAMARVMRLPEPEIEKITWAALLHDIGKIGIRDHILSKEGPLDKAERTLMNQHPEIGAEIVAPATQLKGEAPLILAHHEWFNGSGYPHGVEALDIPLGARIMTIADAYEAMTSSRPYRKTPLTHEQAISQLQQFAGIQFDPEIVPILVNMDRSILDRPPDRPDELPTMLHQQDPRDGDSSGDDAVAAAKPSREPPASRPAMASDDVS